MKEKLSEALSESYDYKVITNHLYFNCNPNELIDCIEYLIKEFDNRHNLLAEFVNSSSDAVCIEASDMEQLEKDFRSYVLDKTYN